MTIGYCLANNLLRVAKPSAMRQAMKKEVIGKKPVHFTMLKPEEVGRKQSKTKPVKQSKAPTTKQFKAKIAAKVARTKAQSGGRGPAVTVAKAIAGVGLPGKCQDGCGNSPKAGSYFMPGHFPKLLAWLRKTAAGHRPDNATVPYYHRVTTPAQARAMLSQFHIAKAGQGQKARRKSKATGITLASLPKAARRKRRTKAEMKAARAQIHIIETQLVPATPLPGYKDAVPADSRSLYDPLAPIAAALTGMDVSRGSPAYFYLRGVLGI